MQMKRTEHKMHITNLEAILFGGFHVRMFHSQYHVPQTEELNREPQEGCQYKYLH